MFLLSADLSIEECFRRGQDCAKGTWMSKSSCGSLGSYNLQKDFTWRNLFYLEGKKGKSKLPIALSLLSDFSPHVQPGFSEGKTLMIAAFFSTAEQGFF